MVVKNYLFLFLCFLLHVKTNACDCMVPTLETSYKTNDIVFTGKVIRVDSTYTHISTARIFLYTFKVDTFYKGKPEPYSNEITLSSKEFNSCDFTPELHQRYLIFATLDQNGFISTTICDDNRYLEEVPPNVFNKLKQWNMQDANKEIDLVYIDHNEQKIHMLNEVIIDIEKKLKIYQYGFWFSVTVLSVVLMYGVNKRFYKA